MQTTIRHSYSSTYEKQAVQHSLWTRFIRWADGQEENRFGWTAGILTGHGCFFTIFTVAAILLSGNHFIYWPFAIGGMAACLVTNLAALPTRIIIPVFFFSLLVDLVIIIICIANGFDISASYV